MEIGLAGKGIYPRADSIPKLDFGNIAYLNPSGPEQASSCVSRTRIVPVFSTGVADLLVKSIALDPLGDRLYSVTGASIGGAAVDPAQPIVVPAGEELDIALQLRPTRIAPPTSAPREHADDRAHPRSITARSSRSPDTPKHRARRATCSTWPRGSQGRRVDRDRRQRFDGAACAAALRFDLAPPRRRRAARRGLSDRHHHRGLALQRGRLLQALRARSVHPHAGTRRRGESAPLAGVHALHHQPRDGAAVGARRVGARDGARGRGAAAGLRAGTELRLPPRRREPLGDRRQQRRGSIDRAARARRLLSHRDEGAARSESTCTRSRAHRRTRARWTRRRGPCPACATSGSRTRPAEPSGTSAPPIFGPAVDGIADATFQPIDTFTLSAAADPTNIRVELGPLVISEDPTNGYTFDSSTNAITLHGTAIPVPPATVTVTYNPRCTP